MTALLVFGASKGTGAIVIEQAIKQGYHCIAVVRRKESAEKLIAQGVTTLIGDANDPLIVEQACSQAGVEATIISTLGGAKANYHAQMNIINQAEKANIGRMMLVTSLGCGDSWSTLSPRAKAAFGFAVREKTLAEVWLQTSHLQYCIFRPGGLVDGEPTHNGKCYTNQEVHGYIMRHDLASLILEQVRQTTLNQQVFSVIDPDLVIERNYQQSE